MENSISLQGDQPRQYSSSQNQIPPGGITLTGTLPDAGIVYSGKLIHFAYMVPAYQAGFKTFRLLIVADKAINYLKRI